jgi:hypothetical protein
MKAITIWQPYASLIAVGAKRIETRSWATKYRGQLAIHAAVASGGYQYIGSHEHYRAALKKILFQYNLLNEKRIKLPHGAVLATCQLIDCVKISIEFAESLMSQERAFGDYTQGRYAWVLEDIRMLPAPVPAKGAQKLWEWTPPEGVVCP